MPVTTQELGREIYLAHLREQIAQMGKDFDEWTGGAEHAWADVHPSVRACWTMAALRARELCP
jgi:hypothetical protein